MLCGARPAMGMRPGASMSAMGFRGAGANANNVKTTQNFQSNGPSFASLMHTDSQLLQAENAKFMIKA